MQAFLCRAVCTACRPLQFNRLRLAAIVVVTCGWSSLAPVVQAATVEVEGAQDGWQAEIDEDLLVARFTETIGSGAGPVLKKFCDVSAAGAWTASVTATNNSGETWTDYHFELLFPPPQLSTPDDGVDFDVP